MSTFAPRWKAALYFKEEGKAPRKYRLHWKGQCKNGKHKAKLGFWGAMAATQFWVDLSKVREVPLNWKEGDPIPEPDVAETAAILAAMAAPASESAPAESAPAPAPAEPAPAPKAHTPVRKARPRPTPLPEENPA